MTAIGESRRWVLAGAVVLGVTFAADSSLAGVVRQLTDVRTSDFAAAAISDDGSSVFVISSADPFGANAEHAYRILALSGPGSGSQVPLPGRVAIDTLSVTDDGSRIFFISPDDLLGTNPDLGRELFQVRADGSNLTQLTDAPAGGGEISGAVVAGQGSSLLLLGTIDPLGSNPLHAAELFVLTPGSGTVTQLTTAGPGRAFDGFDISDDGTRVVFASNADLVGLNADGSFELYQAFSNGANLIQRTSGNSASTSRFHSPAISGNGQWMVAVGLDGVYARQFGGQGLFDLVVGGGSQPSITDDGSTVYFCDEVGASREIVRIATVGGPTTILTSTGGLSESTPIVSGDGSTVAMHVEQFPVLEAIAAIDSNGANRSTLAASNDPPPRFSDAEPHLSADGQRIVFRSTYEPALGNPIDGLDVFGVRADGSGASRLTSSGDAGHPMLSADASTLIFWSDRDLTGGNTCLLPQVFASNASGANVTQLTSSQPACTASVDHPVLAADAEIVIYQRFDQLFAVPATGGSETLIVDDDNFIRKHPRVSDDGQWVVYQSGTDHDGANPDQLIQVFRARTDATFVERLDLDPDETVLFPDLSADGQRVVYQSAGNLLGTNPEGNSEIFLFDAASATTTQLTVTASGDSSFPRISADGNVVWFRSTAPLGDSPSNRDLYRTVIGSGVIERVSGLADPLHGDIGTTSFRDNLGIEIDADGDRAVFTGSVDATGTNPDRNDQLFLVDLAAAPSIAVGAEAPTLVSWDVEPSPWRYDVIRGDAADLSDGGGFVDLGPVVCIEDDSLDARTAGDEDALQPVPGQVLFYLYRGAEPGGPGSYGEGSGSSTRLPASGDCPS